MVQEVNTIKTLRDIESIYGISRRMIQEYERHKLIGYDAKNKYGHLLYSDESINRILFIRILNKTGMSLSEISRFLEMNADKRLLTLMKVKKSYISDLKHREMILGIINDIEGVISHDDYIEMAGKILTARYVQSYKELKE